MLYALCSVLMVGIFILLYGWWDSNHFAVRRSTIELYRLPEAFDGFTILQVSDLHNRAYGRDGMALVHALQDISCDMIAITGDLLDRHLPMKRSNAYLFASEAAKHAPSFFIQGNHERRIGNWQDIKTELSRRDVRVLENEKVTLIRDSECITVMGITDKAKADVIRTMVQEDTCSILLAHHPERFKEYSKTGVDLVLSGHAHGGQVRLFGHGICSPDQGIFPRYTSGIYECGRTKLYVSRGAGNHSFLPPRIFNRPEIDCITLKKPSL